MIDVLEVQARRGFVEDVKRAARVALRQLTREFHPLRLAAGQGRRRLTEADVGQPHIHQGLQLARDRRHRLEERQGVLHGHLQHFVNVLALIANVEGFAVVALALAHIAGHVDVRQEVHLDFADAVALTGLAAAAFDVEAEASGLIAARARLLGARKQLSHRREDARVRGRIGARGAPDGALIDVDALVDVLQALQRAVPGGA